MYFKLATQLCLKTKLSILKKTTHVPLKISKPSQVHLLGSIELTNQKLRDFMSYDLMNKQIDKLTENQKLLFLKDLLFPTNEHRWKKRE